MTKSNSSEWCAIGRELEVSINKRKEIRRNLQSDDDKLEEVLSIWLEESKHGATWRELIVALENISLTKTANAVKEYLRSAKAKEDYC